MRNGYGDRSHFIPVLHPEQSVNATTQGYQHEHHLRHRQRAAHDRGLRQLLRRHHLRPDGPHDRPLERRLRNVLAALNDYGFILRASLEPALPGYGFADVIDHLRQSNGAPFALAALGAAERALPATEPAPAALMPVWAFESGGGSEGVLLGSSSVVRARSGIRSAIRPLPAV